MVLLGLFANKYSLATHIIMFQMQINILVEWVCDILIFPELFFYTNYKKILKSKADTNSNIFFVAVTKFLKSHPRLVFNYFQ